MTTISAEPTNCGTYAGAQRHRRKGEEACASCRRAAADYMRRYREGNEDALIKASLYSGARSRALTRLAALHPAQYDALLTQELGR